MAVSGLPIRNGNCHVEEIANMSLDLLDCAKTFKIVHKPGRRLQLRIGFHTGPCAAGNTSANDIVNCRKQKEKKVSAFLLLSQSCLNTL